jgi:hypothetical protein
VNIRDKRMDVNYWSGMAHNYPTHAIRHDIDTTKQGVRYTISEPARREVFDRLLALNHQRYAEEVVAGLHDKGKKGSGGKGKGRGKKGAVEVGQMGMFD